MEPLCKEGDFVFLDKLSYLIFRPRAGDLIVLKHPQKEILLLKYVITEKEDTEGYFYWVEGLNKTESSDSRNFGWIPKEKILGKAIMAQKQKQINPVLVH